MRRFIGAAAAVVTLAISPPAIANPAAVRLAAQVDCLRTGGAHISFTIENLGPRQVRIDPDFHLRLNATRVGDDVGAIAFVFPAPDFARIPPGSARTFQLDLGEAFEGELGTDLSGLRLHLEAQVWLAGRSNPAVRTFSYPACAPPSSG